MTPIGRAPIACQNMNHRRANSPVPYCPQCGEVVNRNIPKLTCSAEQHALSRRRGSFFCVGCGTQLIVSRAR
jgi:predicted RNA-binding Zn-ribbon protein involved in translation (DUF1610 family)